MLGKLSGWDDTIVALATPPGVGAIAVIRLSGPQSIEIVDHCFPSKDLLAAASHTLHVGFILLDGKTLDEVVVSVYKNPRSYTGEDVVEVSCHGSPLVQEELIRAFVLQGARPAKPGEFTQRAFLNGKLDLAQAEAVADLIASQTEMARVSALHNMRGGFSHDLQDLRERLMKFSALIELELDFSQEDVEFADRKELKKLIQDAMEKTSALINSFTLGNVIKNGVQVAIIGRPNSGKSTLLNAFLNENRAIVSEIPGTTRDSIEELINIEGILFRLIDTAGIRAHTTDKIEALGMERSHQKMKEADIVIYLFDASMTNPNELQSEIENLKKQNLNYLLVGNKADLISGNSTEKELIEFGEPLFISARENQHIDILKTTLMEKALHNKMNLNGTVVTSSRHFHALQMVFKSLQDIKEGMGKGLSGDLIAIDLRRCLHFIGEITGEITTEDQLDLIFSKFCIGK
jgi:tRNA modification GTPase